MSSRNRFLKMPRQNQEHLAGLVATTLFFVIGCGTPNGESPDGDALACEDVYGHSIDWDRGCESAEPDVFVACLDLDAGRNQASSCWVHDADAVVVYGYTISAPFRHLASLGYEECQEAGYKSNPIFPACP